MKNNASVHWFIEQLDESGEWTIFKKSDADGIYYNQRQCYADYDELKRYRRVGHLRIIQCASHILEDNSGQW